MIVTVALDTDSTLKPAYRERYFTCEKDEEEEPLLLSEMDFDLPEQFCSALALEPISSYFMLGPMRWLFPRLAKSPGVVLWPKSKYRQPGGTWFFQNWEIDQVRLLHEWLSEVAPDIPSVGGIVLNLEELWDSRVLWEVANFVAQSYHDYFLSCLDGSEVYVLHHHDKIVVSIPDHQTRQELLDGLTARPDLFRDCSGYTSPADEESGW
jgi:hypothetical protein